MDYIHATAKTAKLEFRRKVHLRNFMYSNLTNTSLVDDIPVNTRSRDAPLFKVIGANLDSFKRSVEYNGALEWNGMSSEIRNANHILFRGEITPLSSSYNISGLVPVCWLLFQCF